MEWIDSHAHLNHEQFAEDWQDALRRAKAVGVIAVINIGYDLPSSERAVQRAREASREGAKLFSVVALHPHAAKGWNEEVAERLRQLAKQSGVVAIGEIWNSTPCMVVPAKNPFGVQVSMTSWTLLPSATTKVN